MTGERASLVVGKVTTDAVRWSPGEALRVARMAARTRRREVLAVEREPRVLLHRRRRPGVLRVTIAARIGQDADVNGVHRVLVRLHVTARAVGRRSGVPRRLPGVTARARRRRVLAVEHEPVMVRQRRRTPGRRRMTRLARLGELACMKRALRRGERRGVAARARPRPRFFGFVDVVRFVARQKPQGKRQPQSEARAMFSK